MTVLMVFEICNWLLTADHCNDLCAKMNICWRVSCMKTSSVKLSVYENSRFIAVLIQSLPCTQRSVKVSLYLSPHKLYSHLWLHIAKLGMSLVTEAILPLSALWLPKLTQEFVNAQTVGPTAVPCVSTSLPAVPNLSSLKYLGNVCTSCRHTFRYIVGMHIFPNVVFWLWL